MSASSPRFTEVIGKSKSDLEQVFVRGTMPDLEKLAGWEFRGMNHPRWARLAGINKFMMGFFWESDSELHGYTGRVIQNPNDSDWLFKGSAEEPGRFGY
jgi:hypothetical protein